VAEGLKKIILIKEDSMNLRKVILVAAAAFVLGTGMARADKDMAASKPATSPEFEKMKSLVGTWSGKCKMGCLKDQDLEVDYKLTAGGTAVLETIAPGTPKEMTTVYHMENGKLVMNHYCTMGNCPKMTLKKSSDNELFFEMKGKDGISSAQEPHMHALDITWKDPDHISASWVMYTDGKANPVVPFVLTRKN